MKGYSVQALAKLAGVSVRTLHHYHQIGLLEPLTRTPSGYRLYGPAELLRLQQILLLRTLEVPLAEIKQELDHPDFNAVAALERQRKRLEAHRQRLDTLLQTVDRTLAHLKGESEMLDDAQLYEGMNPEQAKAYEEEASQRWGQSVAESKARVRKLSPAQWKAVQAEGEKINAAWSTLEGLDPGGPQAQALAQAWWDHLHHFYPPSPEQWRGLAELYCDDPRFRAFYESRGARPELIREIMRIFADRRFGSSS